jgi:hypothetical protein
MRPEEDKMNLEQHVWGFGRMDCPPFEVRCGYQLPGAAGPGMYAAWNEFDVPTGMHWNLIEPKRPLFDAWQPGERIDQTDIGAIIPYGNQTGLGGDIHDTFKKDRYDNIYGGHTTIQLPGIEPMRIDWNNG